MWFVIFHITCHYDNLSVNYIIRNNIWNKLARVFWNSRQFSNKPTSYVSFFSFGRDSRPTRILGINYRMLIRLRGLAANSLKSKILYRFYVDCFLLLIFLSSCLIVMVRKLILNCEVTESSYRVSSLRESL